MTSRSPHAPRSFPLFGIISTILWPHVFRNFKFASSNPRTSEVGKTGTQQAGVDGTMFHLTWFGRMWGIILRKFIKGTRGFVYHLEAPPNPTRLRQAFELTKRSQDRKGPNFNDRCRCLCSTNANNFCPGKFWEIIIIRIKLSYYVPYHQPMK